MRSVPIRADDARDFQGELDKMPRFAPAFRQRSGGVQKKEPPQWSEFFHWKYGLDEDQQEEYERDFQIFIEAKNKEGAQKVPA